MGQIELNQYSINSVGRWTGDGVICETFPENNDDACCANRYSEFSTFRSTLVGRSETAFNAFEESTKDRRSCEVVELAWDSNGPPVAGIFSDISTPPGSSSTTSRSVRIVENLGSWR